MALGALTGINASAGLQGAAKNDEALKKAAKQLESVFYYYMIKAMRDTVPKDGLFDGGNEEEMMTGLLDQQLSVDMAQGGHGSLSELIIDQMHRQFGAQFGVGGQADGASPGGLPGGVSDIAGKAAEAYSGMISGPSSQIGGVEGLSGLGLQDLVPQMPVPVSPDGLPQPADPQAHNHEDGETPDIRLDMAGRVSSRFGLRKDPFTGVLKNHGGVDIAVPEGSEIKAAAPGTVVFAGQRGGYGNLVVVDHGGGVTTYYGHNSKNLVKEGDTISRGEAVALVGHTGRATGPHVHFEVRKDGQRVNPSFALSSLNKFSKVL
jgi:peptidoglycan hydrolase FlgJ